jgi:outer membrane protein insertion porin family
MEVLFPMKGVIYALAAILLLPAASLKAEKEEGPPELRITGYGFLGNRQLRHLLRVLGMDERDRTHFDANHIEDAGIILFSRLNRDGHLQPEITVDVTLEDGFEFTFHLDEAITDPLPRPLRVIRVHYQIEKGPLFYYDELLFHGLEEISEADARAFFIETGALLPLKRHRIYTPGRLEQGLSSMRETLERQGYETATVQVTEFLQDDETGAVQVEITVDQGPQSLVRSARQEVFIEGAEAPSQVVTNHPEEPFSRFWLQDLEQELRAEWYQNGYPDTVVQTQVLERDFQDEKIHLELVSQVRTGPRIRLGEVRFEGHRRTRESVMRRRAPVVNEEFLDRVLAEQGRFRLARLGAFQSVQLSYEVVDDRVRDVVYTLEEGRQADLSFLFGFGSYELLRVGLEVEQHNVFGRAHNSRLRLIQSFRATSAEYTYTMPEFFGEDIDVFFNAFGLRRREINFVREEFGGGVGARRFFESIASQIGIRYNYQVVTATRPGIDFLEGPLEAGVGAVIFDLRHDQRDNPLYPKSGYKIYTDLEIATQYLLSDVNYQRFELTGSYHRPLGQSTWLHLGLTHGLIWTVDSPLVDLPFNKRFFPGGDNSVRGYQVGEAGPRNERGQIVGAETYSVANFEIEQGLTPNWSLVGFLDAIGFARRIGDYPMNEALYSAGAGIRWRTLIGPVRLEYGHNLRRRAFDPMGTIHFSLGFPF